MRTLRSLLFLLVCAAPAAAQDMPLSQVLIDGEEWKVVAEGYSSITSLSADREENVYLSDLESSRLDRIDKGGKVSGFSRLSKGVSGLCFSDGKLYACQPARRRIVVVEGSGEQPLVENIDARSLVVTRESVIYCTVPRDLAVYRIDSNGKRQRVDSSVVAPAALTLWPDEGTLVVGYPASSFLWACRIEKDGSLSGKDRYYALRLPRGQESSGVAQMSEDAARRLYAATTEGVQIYDPTGRMSGVLSRPERSPVTAVTIGGAGHSTLYVGCAGKVYARKIKTKGAFPVEPKK